MEPENMPRMSEEEPVDPAQASPEGVSGGQMNEKGNKAEDIIAQLFPEEIWEMILAKVTDPLDCWSCYNAFPLFRKILHPRKSTWEFEHALPYLFPHLPAEKLLECRLVSRGWKETVDHFLQNHPSLRPHNEDTCNPRTLPFVNPLSEKGLSEGIEFKFDEYSVPNLEDPAYVNATRSKLSLLKTAKLQIWLRADGGQAFLDKIYHFFRLFGKEIWYLSLCFSQHLLTADFAEGNMLQFVFVDLFQFVPNLRGLHVHWLPSSWSAGNDGTDTPATPEMMGFPLPHLETFFWRVGLRSRDRQPCPSLAGLLRNYRSKLRRVNLQGPIWDQVGSNLDWSNLAELHLEQCSTRQLQSKLSHAAMPNLTKLGIGLSFGAQNEDLTTLLQVISDLSTTTRLTTLRLYGVEKWWMNLAQRTPTPGCIRMPPTLKILELDYKGTPRRPGSFFFLVYFPNLENLNVYRKKAYGGGRWGNNDIALLPKNTPEDSITFRPPLTELQKKKRQRWVGKLEEMVEVSAYLFTGEMYKSKIWEVMPRLKLFTFQWEVYTRGGYDDYCSSSQRGRGENN